MIITFLASKSESMTFLGKEYKLIGSIIRAVLAAKSVKKVETLGVYEGISAAKNKLHAPLQIDIQQHIGAEKSTEM